MYEYQISKNGFDNESFLFGNNVILVIDSDTINDCSILCAELKKEYIKYCDLQISFGVKAEEFENIIDDYLMESKTELFFTTAACIDYKDVCELINGWQIGKNKTIRIISKSPETLVKIQKYLNAL